MRSPLRFQLALFFNTALRLLGFKSIKSQFAFAFFLIIAFSLVSVGSLYLTMSASAETVNIAGRQRMLSQRLAKEALLIRTGAENEAIAQQTIALFESSHQALMNGDKDKGIHAPESAEIKQQLQKVEALWLEYKKGIASLIAGEDAQLNRVKEQNLQVLKEMNIAVSLMASQANASLKSQQVLALSLAIAVFIVALISSLLGMHWLMYQIGLLKHRLGLLAEGDFTQRIDEQTSENEVGDMFNAYNRVLEQTGSLVGRVKSLAENVSSRNIDLVRSAETAEKNVNRQYAETEHVASAVTEMSASIKEVARYAADAAENVRMMSSEIGEGKNVVGRSQSNINGLSEDLLSAVGVMQALNDDSQQIGNVLTVITGIAEQTNLLALNAAIEAARAGEQGRGFAVVADEVRTLAQRTQESTEEIRKIIESLQSQTGKAVKVMEDSTIAAKENAEHIARAAIVLNEVVAGVNNIENLNAMIATASQEQAQASNEIDNNVANISTLAGDTQTLSMNLRNVVEHIEHEAELLGNALAALKTG